ncbi:hypothetical protein ACFL27_21925 [candidate division CSSED10-310 bacterium]|uniref:Uncharacterized protein n=1 Tax=candidate division CSSED10-310 bacterium TaxID=2855610 RepID=A0ABV6Z346_UNCC1
MLALWTLNARRQKITITPDQFKLVVSGIRSKVVTKVKMNKNPDPKGQALG